MNEFHREALKKNTSELVQDIIITERFLAALDEKKIFEQEMLEMIKGMKTESDKVYKLLDLLPRRGPEAFNNFLLVLQDQKCGWLATKLCDTVQVLMKKTQPVESDKQIRTKSNMPDKDIKQRVSSFVQRQFGQVRHISNIEKKSIEEWLGEWAQAERKRLMQKTTDSDYSDKIIQEKPNINEKLYKLHTKLRFIAEKSKKDERNLGVWTSDTITFEAIEEHIDLCFRGLIITNERMQKWMKEKEAKIKQLKDKNKYSEKIQNDIDNTKCELKKKDQTILQYKNKEEDLNKQVNALHEENSCLEFEVTRLNEILTEMKKELGEKQKDNIILQERIIRLQEENQDLKHQKYNPPKTKKR